MLVRTFSMGLGMIVTSAHERQDLCGNSPMIRHSDFNPSPEGEGVNDHLVDLHCRLAQINLASPHDGCEFSSTKVLRSASPLDTAQKGKGRNRGTAVRA